MPKTQGGGAPAPRPQKPPADLAERRRRCVAAWAPDVLVRMLAADQLSDEAFEQELVRVVADERLDTATIARRGVARLEALLTDPELPAMRRASVETAIVACIREYRQIIPPPPPPPPKDLVLEELRRLDVGAITKIEEALVAAERSVPMH